MDQVRLLRLVKAFERPKRVAVSTRFPIFKKPVIVARRHATKIKNVTRYVIARRRSDRFFQHVVARHQSVLLRKLGDSDPALQKNKVVNIRRACQDLNGLIIQPGQVFLFWEVIGKPTRRRGYIEGMLLSSGRVTRGVGGGLCQLSNFMCWLFLHAQTEVLERYHHSMDVFPDTSRTLPFGSGATCLFNFIDLKIKNVSPYPLQLKVWLTDKCLKGQLLSPGLHALKFSVREKDHVFIKRGSRYFRYNEIWRVTKSAGKELKEELVFTNFAPVLYRLNAQKVAEAGQNIVDLPSI